MPTGSLSTSVVGAVSDRDDSLTAGASLAAQRVLRCLQRQERVASVPSPFLLEIPEPAALHLLAGLLR